MEARNRSLRDWFVQVRTSQIKLPRFQRYEAWDHEKVANVLESVLCGLPVGAALILEVGDQERFLSRYMVGAPDQANSRVTEHLLDGQQRLTAMWRSFNDLYEDRTYFVYFEISEELVGEQIPRVFGQARWKHNGLMYPLWANQPHEIHKRGYIPMVLLRPEAPASDVQQWCDAAANQDIQQSRAIEARINKLREQIIGYNIPFLSLPSSTPKSVALDVFIKLNTSSVRLTTYDILVAQVEEQAGRSLHDLLHELIQKMPSVVEYTSPQDLVLSVAALREDRAPTQATYQNLDITKLVTDWDKLEEGIQWMIEFLEEERIFDRDRLPTVAVLPVLAALKEYIPSALDGLGNAKTLLRKYLWRSFLTRRYFNSQATGAIQDFRALRDNLLQKPGAQQVPIFDEERFPLPNKDELRRAGWPKKMDTLARGILAVSIYHGALDIADGTPASREHLKKREYHHLFPDSLLVDQAELLSDRSYSALNCAVVTWNTNRNIGAKEPLQYLKERAQRNSLGADEIRNRLSSHLVPYDLLMVGNYSTIDDVAVRKATIIADYDRFCDRRSEIVLEQARKLCNGETLVGAPNMILQADIER